MIERAPSLRERTRNAVRSELMASAMELFLAQGFAETTVDQIATSIGLSRRSFFRYFDSKDDVLAATLATSGAGIAAALTARPGAEAVWTSLRRAFDPLIDAIEHDDRALAMTRMMLESPALRPSHEGKQSSWLTSLTEAVGPRLTGSDGDLAAAALAGAALSCLTAAQRRWVQADGRETLGRLLDVSMEAVRPIQ